MAPAIIFAVLLGTAQASPWRGVLKTLGSGAHLTENGLCRVLALRTDLQVQNASGMLMAPQMGLASWAVFSGSSRNCSADGEICAIQQEIDPVIDDLRVGGIDVLGLGNRFAGEQPSLYFVRFAGQGEADKLAATIKEALGELGKDRFVSDGLNRTGKVPIVDWQAVSLALGLPVGKVGASEVVRAEKGESWVCFGGCPCGRTQLTGSVVVGREKLQAVIDMLRHNGNSLDSISALDGSHDDVTFEAEGDAVRLAQQIREVFRSLAR